MKFRVQRRFEVWGEITIEAESLEAALERAQKIKFEHMYQRAPKVETIDVTELRGTGVAEDW